MYKLYVDASKTATAVTLGYVIHKNDKTIAKGFHTIVSYKIDSNLAEYEAVYEGLRRVLDIGSYKVILYTDSRSVADHLMGLKKVTNKKKLHIFTKIRTLLKEFDSYEIYWIPESMNREAHRETK